MVKELVMALRGGQDMERAPFIPILGAFAARMGQVGEADFRGNAQVHANALLQTADALRVDAVTVGVGCSLEVGLDACKRLLPVLNRRALVACLERPEPAAARAYCEVGVDMVFVLSADPVDAVRFRTLSNVCGFYRAPVILAAADVDDACAFAQQMKLSGAIIPRPTGDEACIVGGGLGSGPEDILGGGPGSPPRRSAFFWSFPGELAADSSPEALVRLGAALTGQTDGVPR